MADGSYIKLHRKITEWGWYNDINTKVLFLHLLLRANWKSKEWQGIEVERGQLISSYSNLASETGLTVSEVRTALKHLILTGEVAHQPFNKFGLFTVIKYDMYQSVDSQDSSQSTVSSQPINNLLATTKEVKKEKNEKNSTLCAEVIDYLNQKTGKAFKPSTAATQGFVNGREADGYTFEDFKKVIDAKCKQWLSDPKWQAFLRPDTLFRPGNFESYLNECVKLTYDENSDYYKLSKCFEKFVQGIDNKFSFEDINHVCCSFEQLTDKGRSPKEIYAVMLAMFKSNNKYMIKKYSDVNSFCKDFDKVGRDLMIDKKDGE